MSHKNFFPQESDLILNFSSYMFLQMLLLLQMQFSEPTDQSPSVQVLAGKQCKYREVTWMPFFFLHTFFTLILIFNAGKFYFTTVLGSVGWRQHLSCDYQVTTATLLI